MPSIHETLALILSLSSVSGEARLQLVILLFSKCHGRRYVPHCPVELDLSLDVLSSYLSFLIYVHVCMSSVCKTMWSQKRVFVDCP